jgi:hypothetical protein
MSEFKLQHLVAELLKSLGGKNSPEKLVENLQKKYKQQHWQRMFRVTSSNSKLCATHR